MHFKKYLENLQEYSLPSDSGGIIHSTTDATSPYQSPNIWTGNSNKGEVPQHNIGLPSVTRRSKVVGMEHKAGGVMEIRLEDRTVLRLTHGDFKRIGGAAVKLPNHQTGEHSILTVFFQRHPEDHTQNATQISKINCENVPGARVQS